MGLNFKSFAFVAGAAFVGCMVYALGKMGYDKMKEKDAAEAAKV